MAITIWNQWARCRNCWRNYKWLVLLLPIFLLAPARNVVYSSSRAVVTMPAAAPVPAQPSPTLLFAVGDIADCVANDESYQQTAALLDGLVGDILILGDIAYPNGSDESFADCYDPVWGRHKQRSRPVPGNHEYETPGAGGYFRYFGELATPLEPTCRENCQGYYSFDVGDWHVVALNSEALMTAGSQQELWLRADLAANRTRCTLAYWHHPRFSSGVHDNDMRSAAVWAALYEFGVDIVLNGHEHSYERFAPQNPAGELDEARGIRQFIVGTGGAPLRQFPSQLAAHSETRNDDDWGVLQLALYPERYEWRFLPVEGQSYADGGVANCVTVADDWNSALYLPSLHHSTLE